MSDPRNSTDGASNTTSETFNASDSDITIQSSDGVLFHLHRKNLETVTGAFQLAEFQTNEKVVDLSESSTILEILFRFIYPRKYPSLEEEDFDTLLKVAEAVEKYEIFSAMGTCEMRLLEAIPKHAIEGLNHGIRYNYSKLINESALALCRRSLIEVAEKLPPKYTLSWIRYHDAWKMIFAFNTGPSAMPATDVVCIRSYNKSRFCPSCDVSLLAWAKGLEAKDTLSDLTLALSAPYLKFISSTHPHCERCEKACLHMSHFATKIQNAMNDIPLFTQFLQGA